MASVLPASGRSARSRLDFMAPRSLDHSAQLGGGDVDKIEEVAHAAHSADSSLRPASARPQRLRLSRAQARSSRATPSATSCSLMISGGSRRTTLSPAATVSIFSRAHRIDEFAGRNDRPQAEQQAFAAHFGDHRRIAVLDLREPLLEQNADPFDVVEEARREHDIERRIGRAHRQRIAAERRAVRSGGHAFRGLVGRKHGADRKTAAQRLGERHDVGRDAGTLIGEQLAGPPHAALHLVEDQQKAVLVAKLAQRLEKRRRDGAHAALAHQRLDHDGRSLGRRSRA